MFGIAVRTQSRLSSICPSPRRIHSCGRLASAQTLVQRDPASSRRRTGMSNEEAGRAASPGLADRKAYPPFPVSGVVGIVKPSGPTSMSLLDDLKPLLASSKVFQVPIDAPNGNAPKGKQNRKRRRGGPSGDEQTPKIGQGGTLDPLADGVLVLGIGSGTKQLQSFLECTKEYRTVGLLGSSTLSYDSQEPVLQRRPFEHVTEDAVRETIESFRGKQEQLPPLYSSIRIDGKRLFDYAREGKDLPRPVERRAVEIHAIRVKDWLKADQHAYAHPSQECSPDEVKLAMRARRLAGLEEGGEDAVKGDEGIEEKSGKEKPASGPAFVLDMTVSSGTYVRSVVHDVGTKMDSAAHVVRLTRLRQGQWVVPGYDGVGVGEGEQTREAVPWSVLQEAIDRHQGKRKVRKEDQNGDGGKHQDDVEEDSAAEERDADGLAPWERAFLERMVFC